MRAVFARPHAYSCDVEMSSPTPVLAVMIGAVSLRMLAKQCILKSLTFSKTCGACPMRAFESISFGA